MRDYAMTLRLEGLDPDDTATVDMLYATSPGDLIVSSIDGVVRVMVVLPAPSANTAVMTALHVIEKAAPDAVVCDLEPELVTSGEIAERLELSRETVRLYAEGRRGPGGFPAPVHTLGDRTRIWDWAEVNAWALRALGRGDEEQYLDRATVAIVNGVLAEQQRDATMDVHVQLAQRLGATWPGRDRIRTRAHAHGADVPWRDVVGVDRRWSGWQLPVASSAAGLVA